MRSSLKARVSRSAAPNHCSTQMVLALLHRAALCRKREKLFLHLTTHLRLVAVHELERAGKDLELPQY